MGLKDLVILKNNEVPWLDVAGGCRPAGFIEMGLALGITQLPSTEGHGSAVTSWLSQEVFPAV